MNSKLATLLLLPLGLIGFPIGPVVAIYGIVTKEMGLVVAGGLFTVSIGFMALVFLVDGFRGLGAWLAGEKRVELSDPFDGGL
jgi:hypothetical protein